MGDIPNSIYIKCLACHEPAVVKRDEAPFCIECFRQVDKIRNDNIFSEIGAPYHLNG